MHKCQNKCINNKSFIYLKVILWFLSNLQRLYIYIYIYIYYSHNCIIPYILGLSCFLRFEDSVCRGSVDNWFLIYVYKLDKLFQLLNFLNSHL